MNFDNQGIVSETFLWRTWVLLLVDSAIYFTETYYKMHCITMGYTNPSKILKLYKNKCLRGSWSLDFVSKTYKKFGLDGRTFERVEYYCIGRVIIITIFPWQVLVITQSYRYNTKYQVVLLQKPQKQPPLEVFCKRSCSWKFCKRSCSWKLRNFTGIYLYWSLFLIKLQTWAPAALLKRDSKTGVFLWYLRNF